jgi:hypothetical protein
MYAFPAGSGGSSPNLGLEMRGWPPWQGCDPGLRHGPKSLSPPENAEMCVFPAGSGGSSPNLGLEMRGWPPWQGCDPGLRHGPKSLSSPERAESCVFLAGSGRFQSQLGTGNEGLAPLAGVRSELASRSQVPQSTETARWVFSRRVRTIPVPTCPPGPAAQPPAGSFVARRDFRLWD